MEKEMNTIPFIRYNDFFMRNRAMCRVSMNSVMESGVYVNGKHTCELENNLKELASRRYAVAVGSCTDALYLALKLNGIGPGDEVIISPFTYIASVSSILRTGATPVFTDINPGNYMMELNNIEPLINSRTKAIMAVHLFGQCIDFESLEHIASAHKLLLVEDAAQALLSGWNGRPAGNMGNVSCFSFDPSKIIGAFGTGGALLTDDHQLAEQCRAWINNGKYKSEFILPGGNSRISEIQAVLLILQLKQAGYITDERHTVSTTYRQYLQGINGIKLPQNHSKSLNTFHKFVVQATDRDKLKTYLKKHKVESKIHYPYPAYHYDFVRNMCSDVSPRKQTEQISKHVLSLPLYNGISTDQMKYIADTINKFYAS